MAARNTVYPHSVIETMTRNVPESVKEFYKQNRKEIGNTRSFSEYAECVFIDVMKGRVKEHEVRYAVKEYRASAKRTRTRWGVSYHENIKADPESSKAYPFTELWDKRKVLSEKEWKGAFGGLSFDKVLKNKMDEMEEWIADPEAPFTSFPAKLTKQRKAKALEIDTFLAMAEVLNSEYGCDIEHTMSAYIDEMTQLPTFGGKRQAVDSSKDPLKTIEMTEEGGNFLQLSLRDGVSVGDAVKTLDQRDQAIIMQVITRSATESVDNNLISVGIHELASAVCGIDKPSASQMDDVAQRCIGIAEQTYTYYQDGVRVGAFNYFSSSVYKKETHTINIVLGDVIQDAILENRLRRIPNADLARIHSKESRIMALPIQKLWIRTFCAWRKDEIPECGTNVTYNMLLSMMSFPSKNKRKNFNIAKDVFQEFMDCGLYIRDFQPDNVGYSIWVNFIPLTESEEKDLVIWGYGNEVDVIDVQFVDAN